MGGEIGGQLNFQSLIASWCVPQKLLTTGGGYRLLQTVAGCKEGGHTEDATRSCGQFSVTMMMMISNKTRMKCVCVITAFNTYCCCVHIITGAGS